jgi:hypothetical protein
MGWLWFDDFLVRFSEAFWAFTFLVNDRYPIGLQRNETRLFDLCAARHCSIFQTVCKHTFNDIHRIRSEGMTITAVHRNALLSQETDLQSR